MTQAEVAKQPVVSVENLHVRFVMRDATVAAVNGISFTLEAGQVLGILGEAPSLLLVVGMGLVLVGVGAAQRR